MQIKLMYDNEEQYTKDSARLTPTAIYEFHCKIENNLFLITFESDIIEKCLELATTVNSLNLKNIRKIDLDRNVLHNLIKQLMFLDNQLTLKEPEVE